MRDRLANRWLAALCCCVAMAAMALPGCTIRRDVVPVAQHITIDEICIKKNPAVRVDDFLPVVQEGIERNGLRSKIYTKIPPECNVVLEYVATRRWDIVTFMADATIELYQNGAIIGRVEYHTPSGLGGGGLNTNKWRSTKYKLDPLLDELLQEFRPI